MASWSSTDDMPSVTVQQLVKLLSMQNHYTNPRNWFKNYRKYVNATEFVASIAQAGVAKVVTHNFQFWGGQFWAQKSLRITSADGE